jgi:predicted aldo/keto reductase-like oxidoreductase
MQAAVQAGKVRFPAFSSHSLDVSEKVLTSYDGFYAVQLPFNFVDNAAAERLIPRAREKQVGFIAMKPLGGGMLDDAELCFRYLNQFDSIIPDPGIERIEEMKEIIGIIERRSALTDEEQKRIEAVRNTMQGVWCHRCQYCMPCPQDIKITPVLSAGSMAKRMPKETIFSNLDAAMKKTLDCTGCRECVERCPYDLDIPHLLEKQREHWEEFAQTGVWPV